MSCLLNVFGGSGFVGSAFCKGRQDIVVNSRDDYTPKTNNIVYFISTVDNYNVLHDPFLDIDTNLTTLMKVLSKCKPGDTFNFISSWFVYGKTQLPATEDSNCNPKGFYSVTKRAAEQLLISYCETFKINYRILRLGNVVGKGDKKVSKRKNALQYLINEIQHNRPIGIYNNGEFIRDFIHVSDVARAIDLIVTKGDLNSIYNVSNGDPIFFKDIIDYVLEKTKSSSIVSNMDPPEFHKIIQVDSMYMDSSKLFLLGYNPLLTKREMIDSLL